VSFGPDVVAVVEPIVDSAAPAVGDGGVSIDVQYLAVLRAEVVIVVFV